MSSVLFSEPLNVYLNGDVVNYIIYGKALKCFLVDQKSKIRIVDKRPKVVKIVTGIIDGSASPDDFSDIFCSPAKVDLIENIDGSIVIKLSETSEQSSNNGLDTLLVKEVKVGEMVSVRNNERYWCTRFCDDVTFALVQIFSS